GILIHLGKGMIEWHFHIFVSLGCLIAFASILPLIAAAGTAAVHHVLLYFVMPASLFNYDASLGIVVIHAVFVVLETVVCVMVAREFSVSIKTQGVIEKQLGPILESLRAVASSNKDITQELSSGASRQASATQQAAATASELKSTAELTEKNVTSAHEVASQSVDSVSFGQKTVDRARSIVSEMRELDGELSQLNENTNQSLSKVTESVGAVSEKANLIKDIVFQTRLLSFNASVEAARAGEQGKGFAVVAEEVGNLASHSGDTSSEIMGIVDSSREHIDQSVESIKNGLEGARNRFGSSTEQFEAINTEVYESFQKIAEGNNQLANNVKSIKGAVNEQVIGIQQLSQAVEEISATAEKNRGLSEKISNANHSLEEMVGKLIELADSLKAKKNAA
ncbi:MAG: methyl-accepting chemotaxis protein, partial [Pseudomonadota bacterium]